MTVSSHALSDRVFRAGLRSGPLFRELPKPQKSKSSGLGRSQRKCRKNRDSAWFLSARGAPKCHGPVTDGRGTFGAAAVSRVPLSAIGANCSGVRWPGRYHHQSGFQRAPHHRGWRQNMADRPHHGLVRLRRNDAMAGWRRRAGHGMSRPTNPEQFAPIAESGTRERRPRRRSPAIRHRTMDIWERAGAQKPSRVRFSGTFVDSPRPEDLLFWGFGELSE